METAVALSERAPIVEALAVLKEKQETAARCTSLTEELAALNVESADLEARSHDVSDRLASAERMGRFERDRLVILGKTSTPESAQLAALSEELNRESGKLAARKREISDRVQSIEAEKSAALRHSAETFRDAAITLIRGSETALAGALDEVRDTLNSLETRLGGELYRPAQLTADQNTDEWQTLHRMYRGRTA